MVERVFVLGAICVAWMMVLGGCYGADLEDETFECLQDADCAEGFLCRHVDDRRMCLSRESEDVRICESYCDEFFGKCDTEETNPYASPQDCLDQCDRFPTTGERTDTSGNTVQCRFYHLGIARQGDTTHCPHAWPLARSGGCTGDCFDFCRDYKSNCGDFTEDPASPEADRDACRQTCREFQRVDPAELSEPPSGDSFECRRHYMDLAVEAESGSTDEDEACRQARSNPESDSGPRCL